MRSNPTNLGILSMMGFVITGPLIDTFAKLTSHDIPLGQMAGARFCVQAALLMPIILAMGWTHRPKLPEIGLHVLRAALIIVATCFFFGALRHMPIADAMAIFFIEPFILTLLGAFLLGESVGPRRIFACIVGFGGAMLVIQPKFDVIGYTSLFPLGTALCFAFYMVFTRQMAQRIHPVTLQGYTALAALVLTIPLLLFYDGSANPLFDPKWPEGNDWWYLLGMGTAATIAHLFISYALSLAPASIIAPLQYLEIAGAVVIGFFVFGDVPGSYTIYGSSLIIFSGLYVFYREQKLSQNAQNAANVAK